MISIILSISVTLIFVMFMYLYRWNITNPNKSSSIKIDNLERTFIYHVPKNIKPNPKLIIVYHGLHLKSVMMQIFTGHGFDILSDQNQDAIIVYPQGYKESWNDYNIGSDYPANKLNLDDVGFTEKIIHYFQENYNIDKSKMFAVGFSNGGQLVMKLANQKPYLFSAYAVISANLAVKEENTFNSVQKPVSIIYFSGVKDPIIPFNGGEVKLDGKSLGNVIGAEESLKYWINASNCDDLNPKSTNFLNKKSIKETTAIQQDFYSQTTNKKVSFIKMFDGGHTIPNNNFKIPMGKMGNMNKEIDAPKIIWNFFMNL